MSSSCLIGVSLVALIVATCGGGGSGGKIACTMGSGTNKTCVEYSIPGGAPAEAIDQAIQGQNDACVSAGGVASSACSHEGADGACQVTSTAPGASQTVTTWVYAGRAATEMMACTSNGQIWLNP